MDTTPDSGTAQPDRPENAPAWFLVLLVIIFVLGFVWIMWSFVGFGGY